MFRDVPIYYPSHATLADGRIIASSVVRADNYRQLVDNANTARLIQNGIAIHVDSFIGQTWTRTDFNNYCKNLYDNGAALQICYELATPVTYTLTAEQVTMLLGNNTIWADSGNIKLTYYTEEFEDLAELIGYVEGGAY